ncbi:MAG TPA: extensin family protein [Propionibacteriaceae bacterium]|nr:extensin family protein [Propionibacteriaceae bacterium]
MAVGGLNQQIRRRTLLVAGVGTAVVVASQLEGCSGAGSQRSGGTGAPGGRCVPRSTLTSYSRIGQSVFVYELSGKVSSFLFDEAFHDQLSEWLTGWSQDHQRPDQVWTYGAFVDGQPECDSMHAAGRAFDIAQLRFAGETVVSCRYDLWRGEAASVLEKRRRDYWALAASLHARFSYVLTYLYNEAHHTHIHVDNLNTQRARPTFRSTSRTQCQSVQAMCTYLWGRPLELTGTWDDATRASVSDVLSSLGRSGTLASGDNWVAFCEASAARA